MQHSIRRMKSDYAPAPTIAEIDPVDLELQDVAIGRKQVRRATRNISIVVLLILIAGASIIGYAYHHPRRTGNTCSDYNAMKSCHRR